MEKKNPTNTKGGDELREQLKNQVDGIISRFQSDVPGLKWLGGSHQYFEGACDEVFDEVEKCFAGVMRQGKALESGDEAHDAIGEIAWAVASFLEETSHARLKLDTLVREKCEDLVRGRPCRRWKKRQRSEPDKDAPSSSDKDTVRQPSRRIFSDV